MRNVEFSLHWGDIERWACEEIQSGPTLLAISKNLLTWCSGEVRECHFSTLGHSYERLQEQ